MKWLLSLLVILPTVVSLFLFVLAYNLKAGFWMIVCIVAGVLLLIPLAVTTVMLFYNFVLKKKK